MSADGERPQYGEFATPEEQQERIRQSGGESGVVGAPPAQVGPVPVDSDPATWAAPAAEVPASDPPRRLFDRILTIALLAYGLVTVVTTVPQLLDFTTFVASWMDLARIDGEFTNIEQGRVWSSIAAVLLVGGWIGTALLSWRALSRRRISWWIPLVGAAVTILLVSVCLTVPILSDPAIMGRFPQP